MLITVSTFLTLIEAQETEGIHSPAHEFVRKAEQHVNLNQIEEAIEIYERIVFAVPDDNESRLQLATLYSRINQHENAAQTYSKLLETDTENIEYQDALVSSLHSAGKHKKALDLALGYIQTEPEKGAHYARIARLYEVEGNVDAAIVNYIKATELAYENKQIYHRLVRLNFLNMDLDAAEIALKQTILHTASDTERQDLERYLLNLYRLNGNLEQKIQKVEEGDTISFGMQILLAEYFHKIGELEKAANAYKRARDMTTNTYETKRISVELLKVYVELGKMYSVVEDYETQVNSNNSGRTLSYTLDRITAISTALYVVETARDTLISAFKSCDKLDVLKAHFEGKLEKNKDNPVALTILARIYWDEKDYKKAAEMYEALGKADSNNVRYLYYAAAALTKSNQPKLADEMIKQAAKALASSSKENDVWFLGALATICIENRMYEPAIELSKAAIDKSDNDFDSTIQETLQVILAKSYRGTRQYKEALHKYQEMTDKSRSSSIRSMAKKVIREIAKEGKLYEKWIPEQINEVEKNPNDPKLILKLAESFEAADKIKEAIEQYEKLTKLEPENAYWYRKLGDLFQRLDRKVDEVIESKALSLDGDGSYVEITDSEIIDNISEQVTVSAWIKPTSFPNTCTTILFKGDKRIPDISHRQFTFWLFDEGSVFFDTSPGGQPLSYTVSPSESIQKNNWCHVAGTIDAKNNIMKLYLNGSEINRNDFKQENYLRKTTLPFRIGCSHEEERSEHASFAGLIDEVRIWNIARTENQIRTDMNKQLKGDEEGLVGYWKFDTETEKRISDSSPNNNNGKLIGNAKLESYTRPVIAGLRTEYLTKAASYYEKAIELQPESYQYYDLLAKLFLDQNQKLDAIAVYRRALDGPLREKSHDSLIHTISELYTDEGQEDKLIAILEEVKPEIPESVVMHELLGDLCNKIGDTDKAELAYTEWLKIRLHDGNIQSSYNQRKIAEKLLEKDIFPDVALKYATRALHDDTEMSYYYPMTLGHAYVANELYDDALRYYKYTLCILPANSSLDYFWKQVAEASKNAKDKKRHKQMLDALINSIPPEYLSSRAKVN